MKTMGKVVLILLFGAVMLVCGSVIATYMMAPVILKEGQQVPSDVTEVEPTTAPKAPESSSVEVLSFRCYPDPDLPGTAHVVGEVKNQGTKTVHSVKIMTTLYDSEDNVMNTDFTYCRPDTLKPNQACTFDSWMRSTSDESVKCGVRVTYK